MKAILTLTLGFVGLAGCQDHDLIAILPDACAPSPVKDGGTSIDMVTIPTPKCIAAKGLAGENLFCADFTSAQKLMELTNDGWNFATAISGTCTGWQVSTGQQLQVINFAGLANGSCGFMLPPLKAGDYQKYNSFILSVVHRVDISETATQKIQVMLGADDPLTRLITQWTGKQARQQSLVTIGRIDLPNNGTSTYQPLFKISSSNTAGSSYQGWLIESIALNGTLP